MNDDGPRRGWLPRRVPGLAWILLGVLIGAAGWKAVEWRLGRAGGDGAAGPDADGATRMAERLGYVAPAEPSPGAAGTSGTAAAADAAAADDDSADAGGSCPPGMTYVAGAERVTLGEDVQARAHDCACMPHMMLAHEFTVAPFCIATYPFPGQGRAWPINEPVAYLSYGKVRWIQKRLPRYERRLCSYAEVLLASAGTENRRFPWGDDYELRCEPDYRDPQRKIGEWPDCRTPDGIFDLGARATWVTLDATTEGILEAQFDTPLEVGDLVVSGMHGPTNDGFAAPNNYGVHSHVMPIGTFDVGRYPGDLWLDDGLRVCADPHEPDAEVEAAWAELQEQFAVSQDYAVFWNGGQLPETDPFLGGG